MSSQPSRVGWEWPSCTNDGIRCCAATTKHFRSRNVSIAILGAVGMPSALAEQQEAAHADFWIYSNPVYCVRSSLVLSIRSTPRGGVTKLSDVSACITEKSCLVSVSLVYLDTSKTTRRICLEKPDHTFLQELVEDWCNCLTRISHLLGQICRQTSTIIRIIR